MTRIVSVFAMITGLCIAPASAASWHQGFCLGNGDTWRSRLPIEVRNATGREVKGEPVAVAIGRGPQQADLVGVQVEALRVCNDAGLEMLYNVIGPDGDEVHAGPIAEGSQLVLPGRMRRRRHGSVLGLLRQPVGVGRAGLVLAANSASATAGSRTATGRIRRRGEVTRRTRSTESPGWTRTRGRASGA